ncbi:MAG: SRPBCC family protein [Microgenomates group bacterium]|jgi:hypothetical protein
MKHYEESVIIPASPEEVFNFVDDHTKLSSHMNESSWMMGGGKMNTSIDEKGGKEVGSHIQMSGKVLGIDLYLDEVVTCREPPRLKIWETVGAPKLLVVGSYQMKAEIKPQDEASLLEVSIDYELPTKHAWLGKLFGGFYAKWCVKQILNSPRDYFIK